MSHRPPDLMPRERARERRRRVRGWTAGGGAAIAVIAVTAGALRASVHDGSPDVRDRLVDAQAEAAEAERAVAQLRGRLLAAETKLAVAREIGEQPDWGVLLDVLAAARTPEIALHTIHLERVPPPAPKPSPTAQAAAPAPPPPPAAGSYRLTVSGHAPDSSSVAAFLKAVEATGLFRSLTLSRIQHAVFMDRPAVGFEVEGHIGGVAP